MAQLWRRRAEGRRDDRGELEPYYTLAEQRYQVRGARGEDPTEPPASAPYPFPALEHEPRIQKLSDDLAAAGYRPFHAPDLTVEGAAGLYAVGDVANVPGPDGHPLPQLGSVAQQSGIWAADNLLADFVAAPRKPFHYHDKGIMAMIGRGAAIAEVGPHRHELHGAVAHAAWLGVHAALMTGIRNRVEGFLDWGWDAFSRTRGPQVLDRSDAARIDWDEDRVPEAVAGTGP